MTDCQRLWLKRWHFGRDGEVRPGMARIRWMKEKDIFAQIIRMNQMKETDWHMQNGLF